MEDEVVLSWNIRALSVNTVTKFWFKKSIVNHHQLLNNVSGQAKSGNLLAIMGPSGAGKTTLLATLSQRLAGGMDGEVMLNGRAVDKELMVRISGFMPQQDLSVTCLTALEHLNFMASLTLDRRVSSVQQQRIICKLINDLSLTSCVLTQISSLSGGERKRLSLAAQMITDPPILFCDEPTTGLDSFSASSVITVLGKLSARNKLVICTIHQPASDVYMMFNKLCLLAPGGRLAYYGDTEGAQAHFKSLGLECPPLYNPADFFLSKLNGSEKETTELCRQFDDSSLRKSLTAKIEEHKCHSTGSQIIYGIEEKFLKFYAFQAPSQKTQLKWLIWRSTVAMFRDSQKIFLRLCMYLLIGILVSSPYTAVKLDQAGIQSIQGFHYAVITETIFSHTYAVLHTFPAEITVMLREINNGVYRPGPYYFSKVFLMVPRVVIETFLFCVLVFFIVGAEGGSVGLLLFSSPVIASGIASTAYGCCISAMFENVTTASLLTVPLDFISYTFSGLFLYLSAVPFYLKWVKYISRFYYGIEAMSILQWRQIGTIGCSENLDVPCIKSGMGVLNKYGFRSQDLPIDFLGLFIMFVLLHIVGFLFLKRRSMRQSVY